MHVGITNPGWRGGGTAECRLWRNISHSLSISAKTITRTHCINSTQWGPWITQTHHPSKVKDTFEETTLHCPRNIKEYNNDSCDNTWFCSHHIKIAASMRHFPTHPYEKNIHFLHLQQSVNYFTILISLWPNTRGWWSVSYLWKWTHALWLKSPSIFQYENGVHDVVTLSPTK